MKNPINKKDYLIRIVDDDEQVRDAMGMLLEAEDWPSRAYASANELLTQDDRLIPGVLLLDVRMPEINGLQLQDILIERGWDMPVIFVTGHADIDVAISSLKRGAEDFLIKPVDEEKLLRAIEDAILKKLVRNEHLSEEQALRQGLESLTERQKDILICFLKGATDAMAAERYGVSERTVQGHRGIIYRKLGAKNAKGLAILGPKLREILGVS